MSSDYLRRGRHGRGNTRGASVEVVDVGVRTSKGCWKHGITELRIDGSTEHTLWELRNYRLTDLQTFME